MRPCCIRWSDVPLTSPSVHNNISAFCSFQQPTPINLGSDPQQQPDNSTPTMPNAPPPPFFLAGLQAIPGPSAAKRHRMNGPEEGRDSSPPARASPVPQGPEAANSSSNIMVARWASGIGRSPTGPPPLPGGVGSGETDNNNKSTVGESLLSQALEKHSPAAMIRSSLVGDLAAAAAAGGNRDDSASDAASDKPESIMDGLIKSSVDSPADSLHRHLTSPSPAAAAAAAAAAANPLFPPGLEALYRQAGFPSAFLGLAAGAAASAAGSEGGSGGSTGRGGGSGGERGSSGPTSSSPNAPPPGIIPGLPPTTQHGGLQSHAGNPNRKIIGFFPVKVYKTNYFLFSPHSSRQAGHDARPRHRPSPLS